MTIRPELAGGRLTIDLNALVANWKLLSKNANRAECAAVVKANAYGCGIEPVVNALHQAGCQSFFTALPEEAIRVKNTAPKARSFVLNGLFKEAAPFYLEHNLIPILGSLEEVKQWAHFAKDHGKPLPCAIHIDSGMGRLGMSENDIKHLLVNEALSKWIAPQLTMTHYACADDIGHPKTLVQREVFLQISALLPQVPRSAANSAALLQSDGHEFELARPGIALYGGEALNDVPNPMNAVVTLEGRIVQIRTAKAGDAIGYGAAQTLTRDSRIAYLSVGYADGYHRSSSAMGVPMRAVTQPAQAAFNGTRLKGIGRISMDLCAFDVTDIPENEIAAGDWIELFGQTIALDDVARAAGTIGYELLTSLSTRYARLYKEA